MTEPQLIEMVRTSTDSMTNLFGHLISITFAMIVATYYFLNRSRLLLKLLAIVVYGVGFLMFVGMMLEASNLKRVALAALADLPDGGSIVARQIVALHEGWLFQTTSGFMNGALWLLALAVVFILFIWKRPAEIR